MHYLVVLLTLLAACTPHPLVVEAPEPLPSKGPPPGAEPFGYWAGDTMQVLFADTITEPCMRQLIAEAAYDLGERAGVRVSLGDFNVTGRVEVGLDAGQVLVMPHDKVPEGVAAVTTPAVQSGGWIAVAWVAYRPEAQCTPAWGTVFRHEFGHVYGLSDTRDDESALMHWRGTAGEAIRPWELDHLVRRIFNR